MIRKVLMSMIIVSITIGCGDHLAKRIDKSTFEKNSNNKELLESNIGDFEIVEYGIFGDTLRVISTSDFLYYPFGSYENIKGLSKKIPYMIRSNKEERNSQDTTHVVGTTFCFSIRNSYVKFVKDEKTNKIELVFARIMDTEICLTNGISIGITKEEFLSRFTTEIKPELIKNVTVIEFVSGLLGVWHYYSFENDSLSSFQIITDYQISKECTSLTGLKSI